MNYFKQESERLLAQLTPRGAAARGPLRDQGGVSAAEMMRQNPGGGSRKRRKTRRRKHQRRRTRRF